MKLYRHMAGSSPLASIPAFIQANDFADAGDFSAAVTVVDEFLQQELPVQSELFLKRETVPWLISLRRVDEAMERLDYCCDTATITWGPLDERTLLLRNSQMYWAGKVGLARRATKLAKRLLADGDRGLEPRDELHCAIRNNAARIYESSPSPETAEALYLKLLADYDKWGDEGSASALSTRHNYAEFLRDRGEYEPSVQVFQQLLLIVTQMRGISAVETLAGRNDLAITTYLSGQEREAVGSWKALAADLERFLDPGHPLTTEVIGNLLANSIEHERFAEAITWIDKLIEGYGESCDPQLTTGLLRIRNQMSEAHAE